MFGDFRFIGVTIKGGSGDVGVTIVIDVEVETIVGGVDELFGGE